MQHAQFWCSILPNDLVQKHAQFFLVRKILIKDATFPFLVLLSLQLSLLLHRKVEFAKLHKKNSISFSDHVEGPLRGSNPLWSCRMNAENAVYRFLTMGMVFSEVRILCGNAELMQKMHFITKKYLIARFLLFRRSHHLRKLLGEL